MDERRNTLVCSFDHQNPRISAFEIHNLIHDVLRAAEHRVTMIQIEGPRRQFFINHLKAKLNPICHLLALLGVHHILHVFRIRVKLRLFSKSQKNIMKYK